MATGEEPEGKSWAKESGKEGIPDAAGRGRDRASPQTPGDPLPPPPRNARGERAVSVIY